MDTPKQKPKQSAAKTTKPVSESVSHYVEQLATIMGVEIQSKRMVFYVKDLSTLTETQLAYVFERARKECRYFPQIAELLAFADQWRPAFIDDARRILDRGDKPPDYVSRDEAKAFIEQIRKGGN